eukprot:2674037-Rhodomonas_salina.4
MPARKYEMALPTKLISSTVHVSTTERRSQGQERTTDGGGGKEREDEGIEERRTGEIPEKSDTWMKSNPKILAARLDEARCCVKMRRKGPREASERAKERERARERGVEIEEG